MRDRVSTTYLASIACLRVEAKQRHHAIATPRKSRRKDTATRRRELEAVVAHEVGHLKHGDTGRAAQAAAMLSGLSTAKRAGDRMLANKRKEKSDASVAAALAAAGAASSAAGLLLRLA